jgi:outer membrane protein OmpA-like peptidoglycan-associated protein
MTVSEKGMALDICPTSYGGFDADAPPLTCGCPPGAGKDGTVYGANPYYWQSAICRAALHAGVIGVQGGQVLVTSDKAPVFPAVNRNGIVGNSFSAGTGFRVAAIPGAAAAAPPPAKTPATDAAGRPVQAPIAETLRTQRRVQVYINFVTDKADLQPSAEPVLRELLTTLQNDPGLRVDLIGHTDSNGSSAHNQDLSDRRAATVYLWLTRKGIARDRLRSSGRGFTEPLADNATAEGRALNRRVEVKAMD